MAEQVITFGYVSVRKNVTYQDYKNKDGIVFFKDGWGATDHIDVWNGSWMKAGDKTYFSLAKEVWFWDLV